MSTTTPKTIRAKFWVTKVEKQVVAGGLIQRQVVLSAKTRQDSDDNIDWAKYTPSGTISLNVSPETTAGEIFEDALGQDVEIEMRIVPRT